MVILESFSIFSHCALFDTCLLQCFKDNFILTEFSNNKVTEVNKNKKGAM